MIALTGGASCSLTAYALARSGGGLAPAEIGKPLSAIIRSESGAGKSYLMECVAELFRGCMGIPAKVLK